MSGVDIVILIVVLISLLIAVVRGFVKESISLATWVAAFVISTQFAPAFASILPSTVEGAFFRQGISLVVLFIATMVVGGLVNFIISRFVESTGLSSTDRALGAIFGLLRGVLVVCALVIGGMLADQPKTQWWQEAVLLPYFHELTIWILSVAPDSLMSQFGLENS